jgi:HEAT repeat protein
MNNLIKISIPAILALGLCLAFIPLPVSEPYEPVVIESAPASITPTVTKTPQRNAHSSPAAPLETRPGTLPAVGETAATGETSAISLPTLYPQLEQIIALDDLPADEALLTLQQLTHDSDPVIRLAALEAIGDMNHSARSAPLIAMLDDPVSLLRIAALEALSESRDATVSSSIEALVFDDDAEVRIAAIDALATLENGDAVYTLAGLLGDTDSRIRGHAVYALGEIGGEVAISYLLQARYDSHSQIRANADAILQEMGVAGY